MLKSLKYFIYIIMSSEYQKAKDEEKVKKFDELLMRCRMYRLACVDPCIRPYVYVPNRGLDLIASSLSKQVADTRIGDRRGKKRN